MHVFAMASRHLFETKAFIVSIQKMVGMHFQRGFSSV